MGVTPISHKGRQAAEPKGHNNPQCWPYSGGHHHPLITFDDILDHGGEVGWFSPWEPAVDF